MLVLNVNRAECYVPSREAMEFRDALMLFASLLKYSDKACLTASGLGFMWVGEMYSARVLV